MDKIEAEIRYLCVEANRVLNFIRNINANVGAVGIVPNLSYGLVAISPILPALRNSAFPIFTTKVSSGSAHNNPHIVGNNCLPLELLTADSQPSFVVVDGTRNTGGSGASNNKYPDSQQGFLNYAVAINDVITSGDINSFKGLMGVSSEHVKQLRDNEAYASMKISLEARFRETRPRVPYAFKYWNPAELTLAIYNHGEGCDRSTRAVQGREIYPEMQPTVFFVNSVMPNKYHSAGHNELWGKHEPGFFDDDNKAKEFAFRFDSRGVFIDSGLGDGVHKIYEGLFGGIR